MMRVLIPVLKCAGIFIAVLIVVFGALLVWLTITEYRPSAEESLPITQTGGRIPAPGETIKVMTWNIGYASLDSSQDFILDGGGMARPPGKVNVDENIRGIGNFIHDQQRDWDVLFLQEVDIDSRRSYRVNQQSLLSQNFEGSVIFAFNYRVGFVPFPFPDFWGPVKSGLLTLNRLYNREATRISLPVPFKWPLRIANLKRCFLVERVPLGTGGTTAGRELVLANLHVDAYVSGDQRSLQIDALSDFLKAEYAKGNYVIAGGDFNQNFPGINPVRFAIRNSENFVPGTLTEDNPILRFVSDTETPTARLLNEPFSGNYENTQLYVIDGFMLSPNVELVSARAFDLGFRYSDHNPVMLEVRLKEPEMGN
jgi:endonuclease/exonuclease/phosphatase family metal-dependent hydrolase